MEPRRIEEENAVAMPAEQNQVLPSSSYTHKDTPEEEITHLHWLLPELWKSVLRYLGGSDVLSLINCSRQLRDSEGLNKEVTGKLLPLVSSVFMSNQHDVTAQTLLKIRQLNKVTKRAVDDMLKEEFSPQTYWEKITTHHLVWNQMTKNLEGICERKGDLTSGDEGIKLTANPWLGRCCNVDFTFEPDRRVMLDQLLNYMREHGYHISQLLCHNLKNIGNVFSVLANLPNLKVLKLYTKEGVQEVEEYVRPVHYPLLPKLEFLDVEGFYEDKWIGIAWGNTCFNVAFVRHYGLQLKSINCSDTFCKGWWQHQTWYTQRLQNLERLRVTKLTAACYALRVLKNKKLPKLQEIHFHHHHVVVSAEDRFIMDVLYVVNNYAQTLSSFHLLIPVSSIRCNQNDKYREWNMSPLPKLTLFNVNLSNVHSTWFWPFIELKCQNLERLSFEEGRRMDPSWSSENEEIKVLLQTRAFALLPNLKSVRITYGVDCKQRYCPQRIQITRAGGKWRRLSRTER